MWRRRPSPLEAPAVLAHNSARMSTGVVVTLAALVAASFLILLLLLAERRRRGGEIRATRDALQTRVAEHEKAASLLAWLVQSSDDAIIGLGLDGRILTWNAGAQRLYSLMPDEVRGRSIDVLFPRGREAESAAILDRVRRERAIERLETEH